MTKMKLKYQWITKLKNGKEIKQFTKEGKETLFHFVHIENAKNELTEFKLVERKTNKEIVVLNFINKSITNEQGLVVYPEKFSDVSDIELKYFRRVTVKVGETEPESITHHVGFQKGIHSYIMKISE